MFGITHYCCDSYAFLGFPSHLLCTGQHSSPSFGDCVSSLRIRHYGQSKHTRGLFFHFLFVTVVKGFLAISADVAGGGGGELGINTFNVTCGQWNRGMIYVGMATPRIRWDLCWVTGWVEGRRGGGTETQRKKNSKRLKSALCCCWLWHHSSPLPAVALFSLLKHTPCFLTVPFNLSAVVLWD